jgi:hypothetical protein
MSRKLFFFSIQGICKFLTITHDLLAWHKILSLNSRSTEYLCTSEYPYCSSENCSGAQKWLNTGSYYLLVKFLFIFYCRRKVKALKN